MPNSDKKISTFRRNLEALFRQNKLIGPQALARNLLCDVLNFSYTDLIFHAQETLSYEEEILVNAYSQRLINGEPLQYITGKAFFCGNEFYVNRNVLIPRQETQELVLLVAEHCKHKDIRVLDIGTGCGCIAISLKLINEDMKVSALDISAEALKVAEWNAKSLHTKVDFYNCDILTECPPFTYDIVVSNPPYVMEYEKREMSSQVLDYEPHIALFVPNDDPLMFYREIARKCQEKLLSSGGKLLFEINEALGNEVVQLLANQGFIDIELKKDIYETDRIVSCTKD